MSKAGARPGRGGGGQPLRGGGAGRGRHHSTSQDEGGGSGGAQGRRSTGGGGRRSRWSPRGPYPRVAQGGHLPRRGWVGGWGGGRVSGVCLLGCVRCAGSAPGLGLWGPFPRITAPPLVDLTSSRRPGTWRIATDCAAPSWLWVSDGCWVGSPWSDSPWLAQMLLLVDELKKLLALLGWFPLGQEWPQEGRRVRAKRAEAGGSGGGPGAAGQGSRGRFQSSSASSPSLGCSSSVVPAGGGLPQTPMGGARAWKVVSKPVGALAASSWWIRRDCPCAPRM